MSINTVYVKDLKAGDRINYEGAIMVVESVKVESPYAVVNAAPDDFSPSGHRFWTRPLSTCVLLEG